MEELSDQIRKVLEEPSFWHLATVNPDGSPQVSTVWVDMRDGLIVVNSALGRKKPRNLEREPRVGLSFARSDNPYNSISIQGRVVDSYVGDEAEADIDRLAKKYLGEDVYPWRKSGERRISYLIEPTHVYHQDA
jgi:PPOX class probable F420-dependent enzyme